MNTFSKLRFPKTSMVLFIIAALVLFTIPARVMLGASLDLPVGDSDFLVYLYPILVIAAVSFFVSLLLWFMLLKKGIRFIDLYYPIAIIAAIAIFAYFHIALLN